MGTFRRGVGGLLALTALFLLAACGGGSSESSDGGSGGAVEVTATDSVFSPASVDVSAGEVTLSFSNEGSLQHNLTIESLGVDSGIIEPGDSTSVTFDAPSGTTEFVCSIHLVEGMTGEITAA